MGTIHLGVNMEFVRHQDKSFEWGVRKAAELGYEYVEPMVHWGRELLSEAGYFHSISMLDDPLIIRRICEAAGVKISSLSAHCPLCKPEISTEYLKQAIRFAAECGTAARRRGRATRRAPFAPRRPPCRRVPARCRGRRATPATP